MSTDGVFDVRDYGAVCDGVTGDTEAIRAAVNAAAAWTSADETDQRAT